jgi:hypothetical protein
MTLKEISLLLKQGIEKKVRIIMNNFFTNSSIRDDYFNKALEYYSENCYLKIAVPFFTKSDAVKVAYKKNCKIDLIIRLCHTTSFKALKEILPLKNVSVRFYTSKEFHPKLYIFGDRIASIGSSNLTNGGLNFNQELNFIIEDKNLIKDLKNIFEDFWYYAKPLDMKTFNKLITKLKENAPEEENPIDNEIRKITGNISFPNIKNRSYKHQDMIFLKNYQKYLIQFKKLTEIYEKHGKRKSNDLPLRIEIDKFLSWVKEKHIKKESYLYVEPKNFEQLEDKLIYLINDFIDHQNQDFELTISERYPRLINNFSTAEKIEEMSSNDIYVALQDVNAFGVRSSRYNAHNNVFLNCNAVEKIKRTLIYILHGKDYFFDRVTNTLTNDYYRLKHFAGNCSAELLGLVNNEDIPTCNSRLLKAMQWLGFAKFKF